MKRKLFILTGPTSSGKSQYAEHLSIQHKAIIINADSQQIYDGCPILTAVPSPIDSHHYLYKTHSRLTKVNVFKWCCLVEDILLNTSSNAIIVGGTGMYINSFLKGIAQVPQYDRQQAPCFNTLKQLDPTTTIHPNDKYRITREIGIILSTGKTLKAIQRENPRYFIDTNLFDIKTIGIFPDRSHVLKAINLRVRNIFDLSVQEVKALGNAPGVCVNHIGYKEIQGYIEGALTRDEAINKMIITTGQYAKRQMTFLRSIHFDEVIDTI